MWAWALTRGIPHNQYEAQSGRLGANISYCTTSHHTSSLPECATPCNNPNPARKNPNSLRRRTLFAFPNIIRDRLFWSFLLQASAHLSTVLFTTGAAGAWTLPLSSTASSGHIFPDPTATAAAAATATGPGCSPELGQLSSHHTRDSRNPPDWHRPS